MSHLPDATPHTCGAIPATCTATVTQYSACVTDTFVALNQVLGAIPSCSAITLAVLSAPSTGGTTTTPQSCQPLVTACPGYSVPGANGGMFH
jgi:hypothetical protein